MPRIGLWTALGSLLVLSGAASATATRSSGEVPNGTPDPLAALTAQPPPPQPPSSDVKTEPPCMDEQAAAQPPAEESAKDCSQTRAYPVADLVAPVGSGERQFPPFICRMSAEAAGPRPRKTGQETLMELITHVTGPGSWGKAGGKGTIQYEAQGRSLLVTQTPDVHEQIVDLLAVLRRLQQEVDRPYRLEARLVEVIPAGCETSRAFPKTTLVRGQPIHLSAGGLVTVRDGSLKDFLPAKTDSLGELEHPGAVISAGSGVFSRPAVTPPAPPLAVEVGLSLRAKVTSPAPGRLRLDATLETSEMTEATSEGMRLVGQTYRLINQVKLGQPVRLVLTRDERGGRTKWVEFTVSEVPPAPGQEEQISWGTVPPIPR
jgi:hypothetical protein